MMRKTLADRMETDGEGSQLNIPPTKPGGLWKVVVPGIRCPHCGSDETKSKTGKRVNGQGLLEHYRLCLDCEIRFRVIYE